MTEKQCSPSNAMIAASDCNINLGNLKLDINYIPPGGYISIVKALAVPKVRHHVTVSHGRIEMKQSYNANITGVFACPSVEMISTSIYTITVCLPTTPIFLISHQFEYKLKQAFTTTSPLISWTEDQKDILVQPNDIFNDGLCGIKIHSLYVSYNNKLYTTMGQSLVIPYEESNACNPPVIYYWSAGTTPKCR